MNSWIKYFSLCLLVCIAILLYACDPSKNGTDNNNTDSTNQSIKSIDLGKDYLSDKNIKAFEERAIQKLEDLKDYFEILSNSEVDEAFKNQALVMTMELFNNKENTITFSLQENQDSTVQKVDSFFTSLKNGNYGMYVFEIHGISLINRISPLNDDEYKGGLKFSLFVLTKQEGTQKLHHKIDLQCEIIAKKVQKEFGKESKQVWEVFLGDIFQIPQQIIENNK